MNASEKKMAKYNLYGVCDKHETMELAHANKRADNPADELILEYAS